MEHTEDSIQNIDTLVREAQDGNAVSLGKLYELLNNRIYRYLIMRVSHRETAEDIMQTTFLEMIRALPRYRVQQGAKFTTWLFQIVRHRLIDHYRRQKIVLPLDETVEFHPNLQVDPAPIFADSIGINLRPLLHKLPERQQSILYLFYQEQMTPTEIAEVMHMSAISVRVEKHRALQKLRSMLAEKDIVNTL